MKAKGSHLEPYFGTPKHAKPQPGFPTTFTAKSGQIMPAIRTIVAAQLKPTPEQNARNKFGPKK